jgi:hypothetical protein
MSTVVFHKGVLANGYISATNPDKENPYKVTFYWAKYCDVLHGKWRGTNRPDRKWQWCSHDSLIPLPLVRHRPNKVSSIGGRSLDRLIRNVCELPRRRRGDGSDIVICYGQSNHRVWEGLLCLNRHLIMDKGEQMAILGEDLAPYSTWQRPDTHEGWIIKPKISMGGRGIRRMEEGEKAAPHEYYQKEFDKIREFRAHCFLWNEDNPVPFIQEKVIDEKEQLCWNKKQGGRFWYVYQDGRDPEDMRRSDRMSKATRDMITKMSVEALKKLNYDFGGLDFGMDKFGNLKIFEVNSRMGLLEQSLFTYRQMFDKLYNLNIEDYKERRWQ